MKVLAGIFFLSILVFISCKKDKYSTEPQVTVKSISPGEVFQGDIITVNAKFTDDEGDIDSVFIIRKYYAGDSVTFSDTSVSTLSGLNVPDKTRQGDMTVQYEYGSNNSGYPLLSGSPVVKDTTATFGLILGDKANHHSQYSESGRIRLKSSP